ncbi:MAG: MerR family DNA-binding protein [Gammaproteobacteria bacterium]|nr:MerR family DNA-binding protein [Gammaproteobacteria bacterium]
MRVAELASAAAVTPDTVRYYSRIGLLQPTRTPGNGYKAFNAADLSRLKFIRQAQELGLTLQEVRDVLEEAQAGASPCPLVRELVTRHLDELRGKIRDLTQLESRLASALDVWSNMPDGVPRGDHVCHLIETWSR